MKIISLRKAFRVSDNDVRALYQHNELKQEFVVEWSNIHPGTGEEVPYYLTDNVICSSGSLEEQVKTAINDGESDENPYLLLYLDLRDSFDSSDAEHLTA